MARWWLVLGVATAAAAQPLPEGLRVAFAAPAAETLLGGWPAVADVPQELVGTPPTARRLDYRQKPKWALTSQPFRLVAGRVYRLRCRLEMVSQPSSLRLAVHAAGEPRPLALATTRETAGKVRELVVVFPAGAVDRVARLVLDSTGGGGIATLYDVAVEPVTAPVDPYETNFGLLQPTLGAVTARLGRLIQAEDAAPATQVSEADRDGDGRWALLRLDDDSNRGYFADHTVLKSDSRPGSCPALELRFPDLLPGRYRAVLSDPHRGVEVAIGDQPPRPVEGGRGEIELGPVEAAGLHIRVAHTREQAGNPGPVYVDYVRFLPIHDPTATTAVRSLPAGVALPARLTLQVREAAGVARQGELVIAGLPLPAGRLPAVEGLRQGRAADGRLVWLQTVARWRDGSVKWLRVVFPSSVTAGGAEEVAIDPRAGEPVVGGSAFTPLGTSGLAAVLPRSDATAGWGEPRLRLDWGEGVRELPLTGGSAVVEEQTPWRRVARWQADLTAQGCPAVVRARCDSRANGCGLTLALSNAAGQARELRRVELVIPLPPEPAGRCHRLTASGQGETVATFTGSLLAREQATLAEPPGPPSARAPRDGWLASRGARGTRAVGLRDMLERYPAALTIAEREGELIVGLVPAGQPYRWDAGASLTHHLAFAGASQALDDDAVRRALAPFLWPVRALPPPAWVRASGVWGPLAPAGDPAYAGFDRQVADSFDLILTERSAHGVDDFGGVFQLGGYIPGTRRMWTNLEYDFVQSALVQWARTADERCVARAEQAAHHFVDVDLVGWDRDARRIGGSFVHSHQLVEGHHVEGPNFGHAGWPQGPLWVWYLTGDRDVLAGSVGLADYVLQHLPDPAALERITPPYGLREERDAGHALLTLATVHEATGDDRYLAGARQVFDYVRRCQEPVAGNWRTPIYEAPPHRGGTFMAGMLFRGLGAWDEVSGDPQVVDVLRRSIPWLLHQIRDAQGRYAFKEAPRYGPGGRSSAFWYAHAYALAAEVADPADRRRLLETATGDVRAAYPAERLTASLELDVWSKERRQATQVRGGAAGELHDYELRVEGARLAYLVDGRLAHEATFSGEPLSSLRFWSGMRAVGTVRVDRVEVVADGETLLRTEFEALAPFRGEAKTAAGQVLARGGFLELVDGDEALVSARWDLPRPVTRYVIRWRQDMPPGHYGGLYGHGQVGEVIHVGLGQGDTASGPVFHNPRSFAPAVANVGRLLGTAAAAGQD